MIFILLTKAGFLFLGLGELVVGFADLHLDVVFGFHVSLAVKLGPEGIQLQGQQLHVFFSFLPGFFQGAATDILGPGRAGKIPPEPWGGFSTLTL